MALYDVIHIYHEVYSTNSLLGFGCNTKDFAMYGRSAEIFFNSRKYIAVANENTPSISWHGAGLAARGNCFTIEYEHAFDNHRV